MDKVSSIRIFISETIGILSHSMIQTRFDRPLEAHLLAELGFHNCNGSSLF